MVNGLTVIVCRERSSPEAAGTAGVGKGIIMMRNLVNGAVGGALATAVYSAVLMAGEKAGLLEERPPRRFVRSMLPGRRGAGPAESVLATIAHYAFGAACGSAFGLLSAGQRVPLPMGAAYGLAVWYLGYQGMAPSVGAFPPATEDRAGRQATLLAGHLVWGVSLALAVNRLRFEKAPLTTPPVRTRRLHAPKIPVHQTAAS
ncbi:hypothetical protein GCM10009530_45860 [Microbispora corallina]|uniref:DUF1440 domain-containing protein n=2 Tax=Microbispora corallina TaxID=83302 RepID=A0ABQ4FWF2_9ACTN|nr:hypothetical protein Mco01_21550 [Microbispora corallina]